MRSSVLISKINRLIETAGESGDGAALAEEYAEAVNKANRRLDAVIAAVDAKAISDAVRILSEEPPLLEEVSTLDFFQLQDWINLCDMCNWKTPPKIDKQTMERAVEIGETKDAIAPFLSMYKKAVRVNNVRLAVKSLRRLVELDHSQDWSRNLKQAEKQLQGLIVEEFRKAKAAEEEEKCEQLAQELLDGVWVEGLLADGVEEVKTYREKREADEREVKGKENIAILKKCREGAWDRKKVSALLQSIDNLCEKGWKIPDDGQEVVTGCRVRCAQELEQEEVARRWREVNEQLHAAIQKEDCEAIRAALSVPEFLDRDPIEDMLRQAQEILEHAQVARRRKVLQIVVAAFFAVSAVVGLSGWWLKQKVFAGHCADEVAKLTYLEKQAKEKPRAAIQGLSASLAKLKAQEPEVYADPKINQFETRLVAIINENNSRTNQIVLALNDLEKMRQSGWAEGTGNASITNRIRQVETLLKKDDGDYRARLLVVKNSWLDVVEKKEKEARERASKFQATLVSHLKVVTERLRKEVAREGLRAEVANAVASLKEWKRLHSQFAEELGAELTKVEKAFNEALAEQCAYTNAIGKLCRANDAIEVVKARQELIEYHGNYPEVKVLRPLEVTEGDIRDVLSPEPVAVKAYLEREKGGISQSEFETFIKESVSSIAEAPCYYSLYGMVWRGDGTMQIRAISQGKPTVEKPSYETAYKITAEKGSLLSFYKKSVREDIKSRSEVELFLMPSSVELRKIVGLTKRSKLTMSEFEREILLLIDGHLEEAHKNNYVKNQEQYLKLNNPIKDWYSPYRRVQVLFWYMRWLKEDLRVMPNDREITRWYDELERLIDTVVVDDVDESLAWICLWDDGVKARTRECAELLSQIPSNWVDCYKELKNSKREFAAIRGWKVLSAGKVEFDPLDPNYVKNPSGIYATTPGVKADHPLYALRRIDEKLRLVRAFEPGKESPWRKCQAIENTKDGYILGEPLYHVFANGKFIDVEDELAVLEKRAGASSKNIPLFSNKGN